MPLNHRVEALRDLWSRRRLLRSALAAGTVSGFGLTACGVRASSQSAIPPSPTVTVAVDGFLAAFPHLMQTFASDHPSVAVVPVIATQRSYAIEERQPGADNRHWVSLDAFLRRSDFDPSGLLPGTMGAFISRGAQDAVPITQAPAAMHWRRDVFDAAGLPAPQPSWTLAQWLDACNRIQAVIASGKVEGLVSVWGPLRSMRIGSGADVMGLPNPLGNPSLWVGFALGYGGTIVQGGHFDFSDAKVQAGLAQLVSLARAFGAPAGVLPTRKADVPTFPEKYAIEWVQYLPARGFPAAPPPLPQYGPEWRYARFPRLPVRPIVPTNLLGLGVVLTDGSQGTPPPPQADLDAADELLLWLYQPNQQRELAAAGIIPILADPATQATYWSSVAADVRAVGDWSHFQPATLGWPGLPPENLMGDALAQAVEDPGTLSGALGSAASQMNAWVAAQSN